MKTLELKLKKDVLIVEVDKSFNHFKIYDDEIGFIFIENSIPRKELIKGSYKFLCKGSGITEEIASELCHNIGNSMTIIGDAYLDDVNDEEYFEFAKEAVISSVERKKFHWLENPIKHPKDYEVFPDSLSMYVEQEKLHLEAEEKTFKNPLIFVKK